MLSLLLLLVLFILIEIVATEAPSGVNRLSTEGLQMILDLYKDPILQTMNNASIPDIEFSTKSAGMSIDFKLKDLMFQELSIPDIWIATIADVGYSAGVDNGVAIINFDWSYEMLSYPFDSDKGSGQMVIDNFYGSCIITVSLKDNVSSVQIEDLFINIGSFDLSITSNSMSGGIISLIIDLMSPYLTDYVGEVMTKMFMNAASAVANSDNGNTVKEVDDKVDLLWLFVNGMTFDNIAGVNYIKILYKPKNLEMEDIPYSPSPMPEKFSNDPLQYMFDFTIFDSAWFSYFAVDYFKQVFEHTLSGERLTIKELSNFIPSLSRNYPESTLVNAYINCDKLIVSETYYTGIYRELQCEMKFSALSEHLISGGYEEEPIVSISGKIGYAEQTKLYDDGRRLGLVFYYHSSEIEQTEILTRMINDRDDVYSDNLFAYGIISFVTPMLNEWGEHISFVHFISEGLKPTNIRMEFRSTYVALGYEPALDI